MDIIINEYKVAQNSIETGYIDDKKPTTTIKILIKYYRDKGMDKEQIRSQIEDFMVKNYKDFNSSNWQDSLDRLVKTYFNKDYKLVQIEKVKITQNELNKIKELDNIKLEKLAFTLLVYAKILNQINDKNNNWVNKSNNMVSKDARIKETGKSQKLLFKELKDIGYITYAKMVNKTSMQINYIDENSEVAILLIDFRNFILEYLKWKGEDIKYCSVCGRPIELKTPNSNVKYCEKCYKEKHKEQDREYQKKKYNSRLT